MNQRIVFRDCSEVAIEAVPVPDPDPGEVLVRTERTLVSIGTELTVLSGEYPPGSTWDQVASDPFVPGYSNVGEVVETGDGVDAVEVGDRVASPGSHAAYVTAAAADCRPVPEAVSSEEAVFFALAEIAMNGLRRGELDWGETLGVFGLGVVGQLGVRLGYVAGARPVVGFDLAARRRSHLPDRDGVVGVDAGREDATDAARRLASGPADLVVEATGSPEAIPGELDFLRAQGRFVVVSSPRGETSFDFHDHCNAPSYTIVGAHNGSHPPVETPATPWTKRRHAELFFEYVADGSVDVSPLVSHRCPVDRAPELYDSLLDDRTGAMGIVFEW